MPLVLVVCTGNACRSPIAEGFLKARFRQQGELTFCSAGIAAEPGMPATPEAIQVASEHALDISQHQAQMVTSDLMARATLVITMAPFQAQWLKDRFPYHAQKVVTLGELAQGKADVEIADPIGHSLEYYRQTAREIRQRLQEAEARLLQRIGLSS